jgi:hypothetical protein
MLLTKMCTHLRLCVASFAFRGWVLLGNRSQPYPGCPHAPLWPRCARCWRLTVPLHQCLLQIQESLERFVKSTPEGLLRSGQALNEKVLPLAKVSVACHCCVPRTAASPDPLGYT